jgi:hypothetical protein
MVKEFTVSAGHTDSRRGFLIGSASLLAAPAIARADWLMPVKIVEYSDGTTMDVLCVVRNQKVKSILAATKKGLDQFLEESGFAPEQVLHGKSYEQWFHDYESQLRKDFDCPRRTADARDSRQD